MKWLRPCLIVFLPALCACTSLGPNASARSELAPTGKLRFGVVSAPAPTVFFVSKDAAGEPHGVTAELGNELATRMGVPVEFMVTTSSGTLTDALSSGFLDAAFMPPDDERRQRVDFGPLYVVLENTYLVTAASGIRSMAEVDRPGVRVIGIAATATIRAAGGILKNTKIAPARSVDEAMEMLRAGQADAFALTRDSLSPLAARLPGSRVLDGAFQKIGVAIAVPKNRPNALAFVTAFIENAKASGVARRAFDNAGFKDIAVAPPSEAR